MKKFALTAILLSISMNSVVLANESSSSSRPSGSGDPCTAVADGRNYFSNVWAVDVNVGDMSSKEDIVEAIGLLAKIPFQATARYVIPPAIYYSLAFTASENEALDPRIMKAKEDNLSALSAIPGVRVRCMGVSRPTPAISIGN